MNKYDINMIYIHTIFMILNMYIIIPIAILITTVIACYFLIIYF